jgi:hypothetical protein
MKIDRTICVSKSDLIERSDFIIGNAGATIEDETGETDMNRELRIVTRQRLVFGQFLGFSELVSPVQSIYWVIGMSD